MIHAIKWLIPGLKGILIVPKIWTCRFVRVGQSDTIRVFEVFHHSLGELLARIKDVSCLGLDG